MLNLWFEFPNFVCRNPTPDLKDRYRASYAIPVGGSSEDFLKQLSNDLKTLTETAKKGKISINN